MRWTHPAMTTFWRFHALLLGGCLLASCSSLGGHQGEPGVLIVLRDFRSGERFELASEAHTERVSYYSDKRADAARKVQENDIMAAFVAEIERRGFEQHAQPGRAPSVASSDVIRWGLEIERGQNRSHWLVGVQSPGADWKQFQECRDAFLELYNVTVSFQAVQNESGKQFFSEQARAGTNQKK